MLRRPKRNSKVDNMQGDGPSMTCHVRVSSGQPDESAPPCTPSHGAPAHVVEEPPRCQRQERSEVNGTGELTFREGRESVKITFAECPLSTKRGSVNSLLFAFC